MKSPKRALKSTVLVADIGGELHLCIFDKHGKLLANESEKTLGKEPQRIERIDDFRKQFERMWPPETLTDSEKLRAIIDIAKIVGYTPRDED